MIGNFPARHNIRVVKGDAIDLTFHVARVLDGLGQTFYTALNQAPDYGIAYTVTNITIRVRRKDGLLIKEWLTGVSPADIVCTGATFHLTDDIGFEQSGMFDYQVEDTVNNVTIISGYFWVEKEIT